MISETVGFVKEAVNLRRWIEKWRKRSNPLKLSEVCVGGIAPERIATEISIDPNLLAEDESDAISPEYYLNSSEYAGWAGECVIRFRLENQSDRRVSVRGIYVDKHKLTI